MRLGTQTASLTNHIYSRMTIGAPDPKVGDGATVLCWTDRHAATVTDVIPLADGKRVLVIVQEDIATRADANGLSETQEYRFQRNHDGRTHTFRREVDGKYREVRLNRESGRYVLTDGGGLIVGRRDHYHDFSF